MHCCRVCRHGRGNRSVATLTTGPDLLVLGAGPAGVGAALSAAAAGLDTVIVDEAPCSGGQVYRALHAGLAYRAGADPGPDARIGEAQRRQLAASTVRCCFGRRVWSVSSTLRVDAIGPDGPETWQPRALVVAAGTTERVVPFLGWTTPGVMGLAAATLLLKSQHTLPGQRPIVAGSGPLLAAVAHGILKAGGEVAAIVDIAGRAEWLAALPALAPRASLVWRGLSMLRAIRARRVPIFFGHRVSGVHAADESLVVEICPVEDSARTHRIVGDALLVGHGLTPAIEVTRLLRAQHIFQRQAGGWIPEQDPFGRSSVPGLYVAGDGAGIMGADPAFLRGRLAGLAAAHDLGRLNGNAFRKASGRIRRRLRTCAPAGRAMANLMALRPAQVAAIPGETIVCRCEDVTRDELEAAITAGARDLNQLKAWTRCGMGPCQGRMCGEIAAELVARHVGGREAAGYLTGRAPLRPIGLADLTGTFTYADIPIPVSAPL